MTRRQLVRLETLRRVNDFGALYVEQFPAGSAGRNAFDLVAQALNGLGDNHKAKIAAAQEGFRAKKEVRRSLSRQLDDIVRAARFIGRTTTGFDDGFRLPKRRNDQVLIDSAKLFVERATPKGAEFIAFGLPQAFLTTLQADLQAFQAAIAACEDGSRDSAAAQAAIKAAIKAGFDAVTRLDIIVANQFRGNVAVLASWQRDRQTRAAYRQSSQPRTLPNPANPASTDPAPPVARAAEPVAPVPSAPALGALESALRGDAYPPEPSGASKEAA